MAALQQRQSAEESTCGQHPLLLFLAAVSPLLTGCAEHVEKVWPDGTARFDGAVTIEGERDGEWSFHYPDGSLREQGRYDNGQRIGTWRQWHKDGQLISEGERRFDAGTSASERQGAWTFWYADGTVRARGLFSAGRREGPWEFFDEEGLADPEQTGSYVDGERTDG
jgi:hypothetical protein